MPESEIFVAIPCGQERDSWINPRLAAFLTTIVTRYPEIRVHFEFDARPVTLARNRIVRAFLATNREWLCTIDNDMRPDPNLLSIVDDAPADASIVVPEMYCPRESGAPPYLAWGFPGQVSKSDSRKWVRLCSAGTGVMFIRRSVFQVIPGPWFEFGAFADGSTRAAEDCVFCEKAGRAGLQIYGNRAYRCGHFRTIEQVDGENRAMMKW